MIWDYGNDGSRVFVTFGTLCELASAAVPLTRMAAMKPWQPTLIGADQPERFDGQRVSASYFRALGVSPSMGRDFEASDDQLNGSQGGDNQRWVVAATLWRRQHYHRAPDNARRQTLHRHRRDAERVRESTCSYGGALGPLQYDKSLLPESREWGHHLAHGSAVTLRVGTDQAKQELNTIAETPIQSSPDRRTRLLIMD